MTPLQRFATSWPVCCAVCRRRASGTGYSTGGRNPILWLCDDATCISLGRLVYTMTSTTFDSYELAARAAAGHEAGAYLDEIGKTDLAELDEGEWLEFLGRVIEGFSASMRRQILEHQPPF